MMSSESQCGEKVLKVLEYRHGLVGTWQSIAFCEQHGGLMREEAELIRIADGKEIVRDDQSS